MRDLSMLPLKLFWEWSEQSLAQLGDEMFAEKLLRASTGDPFETSTPESALRDLHDLRAGAGSTFAAERWILLSDEIGEIGVVLPQVYSHAPRSGTLFYVGVMPNRRGEGLGREIHQFGLQRLLGMGVLDYRGSTDAMNVPMLAIFKANGCVIESQLERSEPVD